MSEIKAKLKYLANTYLPLRLSFVNEAARLVNSSGGNLDDVLKGVGMDTRIGQHYFSHLLLGEDHVFQKTLLK